MFEINRLLNAIPFRKHAAAEFQKMLDWRLLRGSHEFPGPDGGTCINEAAIVAAGYSYRPVHSIDDCPSSFSRPIAMFALCLNDLMEDAARQKLLVPFVDRLAGTADAPAVELRRAELMLWRTASDILAPALAQAGFGDLAQRCRLRVTAAELVDVARLVRGQAGRGVHLLLIAACDSAADAAQQYSAGRPTEVVRCLAHVIGDVATMMGDSVAATSANRATLEVFERATAILAAMLAIGNANDASGSDVVAERMQSAKRVALRRERGCKPVLVNDAI